MDDLKLPSASTPVSRRRKRRLIAMIAVLIALPVGAYLAIMALMYLKQDDLIFAGNVSQGRPDSFVEPPKWASLVRLSTSEGERVIALYAPAANRDGSPRLDSASCPTALYFYGSGMYLGRSVSMLDALRRDGLNVLMPDYVGYGMSGGKASERGCRSTADAAYEYLVDSLGVDPRRIVVEGGSLGAAVAIDLASRREVGGLVVMSGFTSLGEVSRLQYPWLPIKLLLNHPFNSLAKIGRARCPTLITHGTADPLIPYTMSIRLAEAAEQATHQPIPGADHDDTIYLAGPSGALLPTNLRGPHHRFTDEVNESIRSYFARVFGAEPAFQIVPVESRNDGGRR